MRNRQKRTFIYAGFILLWMIFILLSTFVFKIKIDFWITMVVYVVSYTSIQFIPLNFIKKSYNKIKLWKYDKEIDDWIEKEMNDIE